MLEKKSPRLRTVEKINPPYLLNQFPGNFGYLLGREIVYLLATKDTPRLEGSDWEQIFANCIGAEWKPSNVGLDDVILGNCAWGAKTVKNANPFSAKIVRLISGRNSPFYSFEEQSFDVHPQITGDEVLKIWNARVEAIRSKFQNLRTVVLIKSDDLTKIVVFETNTVYYPIERYFWERNNHGNLQGYDSSTKSHKFTWQPHGSQFTIKENVPQEALLLEIRKPEKIDKDTILEKINFNSDWIKILIRKKDG